jgi:hypothetical protein
MHAISFKFLNVLVILRTQILQNIVRKSLYLLFALSMVFLMTSCRKEEGRGGKFTIKGKVYSLFYDEDMVFKTGEGYISDHDVYIVYGDADSYGDKISTGVDGSFEFNFLRKGKYTIYTYSKDTTRTSSSGIVPVSIDVTISDDVELEDLRIVEEERKLFRIVGKVKAEYYGWDKVTKNSESYIGDQDVYAINLANPFNSIKATTNSQGMYEFNGIPKGSYKVYTFYEDFQGSNSSGNVEVFRDTVVTNSNIVMPDFVVKMEDKKLFTIQGKIKAQFYSLDFVTVNSESYIGDHEVYVVNQSSPFNVEKADTRSDGSYLFSEIPAGNYKVYTFYKDFQASSNSGIVEVFRDTVVTNSNIIMPDLIIKHEDEKMHTITGKIWLIEIDQFLIPIDQYYAGDIDVYIVYGNSPTYGERVRTSFNGTYQFVVPDGNYTIYAFSVDETGLNQRPIHKSISTTVNDANVTLNDLTIYD